MSSPLAKNLLREFVNWRPRYTKEERLSKCRKCKHTYDQYSVFPMFGNLFLDVNSDSVLEEEDNNNSSVYTFCSLCNCSGFEE